jgi:hypothetical protein
MTKKRGATMRWIVLIWLLFPFAAVQAAEPDWKDFTVPDSIITVAMPDSKVESTVRTGHEVYYAIWNKMAFSVMHLPDLKLTTGDQAEKFLDDLLLAAKAGRVGKMRNVHDEHRIKFPEVIGYELKSEYEDRDVPRRFATNRIVIIMREPMQAYIYGVTYNAGQEEEVAISHFLSSLRTSELRR